MSTQTLLPELLDLIFQLIPRKDLYQCILVCKSWSNIAGQQYYKEITLSYENTTEVLWKIQNNSLGSFVDVRWVKKLNVRESFNRFQSLQSDQFVKLLLYLPNLRIINLPLYADYPQWYSDTLNSAMNNNEGCLNKLEEINIEEPSSNLILQSVYMYQYFQICYIVRQYISRLAFNCFRKQCTFDGEFGNWLYFLPRYTKLTRLELCNYNYTFVDGDSDLDIFSILGVCNNLVEFHYKSQYSIPETTITGTLLEQHSSSTQRLNTFNNPHLKVLKLQLPRISVSSIRRMALYINLGKLDTFNLTISVRGELFDEWVRNDDNMDTLMEIGTQIGSVKNTNVTISNRRIQINDENNDNIMVDPVLSRRSTYSRLWQIVCAIKRNRRNLHCSATFDVRKINIISSFVEIKAQNNVELKFLLTIDKFNSQIFDEIESCLMPGGNSNAGPHMIDSLDIQLETGVRDEDIMTQLLQKVLSACSQIRKFYFYHQERCLDYYAGHIPPYYDHLLVEYPKEREECNEIKISGSTLTPKLLHIIYETIPNVQLITCTDCMLLPDADSNPKLDLTKFQQLDHIILVYNEIPIKEIIDYIFVRFVFSSGSETICYILETKSSGEECYPILFTYSDYIEQRDHLNSRNNSSVISITCYRPIKLTLKVTSSMKKTFILLPPGSKEEE